MKALRKTLSILAALLAALMAYATLTMPAISATAPAIFTVALAAVAWFLWPKKKPSGNPETLPQ